MNDEPKGPAANSEIESLNEKVLDADEISLDELEEVSGGSSCGTNSCGTFT